MSFGITVKGGTNAGIRPPWAGTRPDWICSCAPEVVRRGYWSRCPDCGSHRERP